MKDLCECKFIIFNFPRARKYSKLYVFHLFFFSVIIPAARQTRIFLKHQFKRIPSSSMRYVQAKVFYFVREFADFEDAPRRPERMRVSVIHCALREIVEHKKKKKNNS